MARPDAPRCDAEFESALVPEGLACERERGHAWRHRKTMQPWPEGERS